MDSRYLKPTAIIDSDHPDIQALAREILSTTGNDPVERAVRLYYWVRDRIRYNPYRPFHLPEHYQASRVLKSGQGFCIPKASLLCALERAAGIASRVGFARVKNHMATPQLRERMGDTFDWHGYVEFYLEERWVKCTPAFNADLCARFNVAPLDFDGRQDSIFQEFNADRRHFMTYEHDYGPFFDIPVEKILSGWERIYGKERIRQWIAEFEQADGSDPAAKDTKWSGS